MPAVTYASQYVQVTLDGTPVGFVKSVDGGSIAADVLTVTSATDMFGKKQIGAPKYEPLVLEMDLSMGPVVYEWVTAFLQNKPQRKSGSIVVCDYNFISLQERQFTNALITEVSFPAMDGADKDPASLVVRIAPESMRYVSGSGKTVSQTGMKTEAQKLWLASNFKLEIPGLECSRVRKVDAFSIKQSMTSTVSGATRQPVVQPGRLELSNLKVSLSSSDAQSWITWHEDFLVKGNNGDDREKTASLTLLPPDLQGELARITFSNVGICRFDPGYGARGQQPATATAELYVERVDFQRTK